VHYLGVVSLGLDWQLNKDVSFSELVPNLASVTVPRGQTVNSEYYSKVINIIITFEINELIIFPVHLN
jgi:hypothetical protein